MGATVTPLMGDRQLVISSLAIASGQAGFDLDGNGTVDNKLSPLGALANSMIGADFMAAHQIVVPLELFGYNGEANTSCTKLTFYVGKVNLDRDGDGKDTTWEKGKADCMDHDGTIHPGMPEMLGDRVDNDCSGLADDMIPGSPPSDMMDLDGDGFSLMQGDCDDRNDATNLALAKSRHPGAKDLCDDGIDQDCDGIADNDPSCDPFKMNNATVYTTSVSYDAMMKPLVNFKDGAVKANVFNAGPDLFNFTVPLTDTPIALVVSGAHLQATFTDNTSAKQTTLTNGLLGGVIEAVTMQQVTGLKVSGFLAADQSLLDGLFLSGAAQAVLGLDTDKDGHLLPDIDVDGDGIETFWQEDATPMGQSPHIDHCKDGDGSIVISQPGAPCALAKDAKGNYRFVDGLSIALSFQAVPAKISSMVLP
jgi:Putative metal-binding motif